MNAESAPNRAVNTQRPHMLNVNINSIDEEIFTPETVKTSAGTFVSTNLYQAAECNISVKSFKLIK